MTAKPATVLTAPTIRYFRNTHMSAWPRGERILATQRQPGERRLERPEPGQDLRKEHVIAQADIAPSRLGQRAHHVPRFDQNGVLVKLASRHRPAGQGIMGIVLEQDEDTISPGHATDFPQPVSMPV